MLGVLLQAKGLYSESLFELRAANDLGAELGNWTVPAENPFTVSRRLILVERRSQRWVAEAERRAEVERRFERVVRGEEEARDPDDEAELARLALRRGRVLEAARLFQKRLGRDRAPGSPEPRAEAASAAAALACGAREDASGMSPAERARWRSIAAAWMTADLDDLAASATSAGREDRVRVTRTLGRWRHDPRLECVRGEAGIAALPAEEQAVWTALWARLEQIRGGFQGALGARTK
jgi:hypothetical protein